MDSVAIDIENNVEEAAKIIEMKLESILLKIPAEY